MSINEQYANIERLMQEILEHENFIKIVKQNKRVKSVELAQQIANLSDYRETSTGRKRRKINDIIQQYGSGHLS